MPRKVTATLIKGLGLFLNNSIIKTNTASGTRIRYNFPLTMFEDIMNDKIKRTEPKVIPKILAGNKFLFDIILKNSYRATRLTVNNISPYVYFPRSKEAIIKIIQTTAVISLFIKLLNLFYV